jgi:hypothetical protein
MITPLQKDQEEVVEAFKNLLQELGHDSDVVEVIQIVTEDICVHCGRGLPKGGRGCNCLRDD